MPLSNKVTKFHKDLNISTMILSESLCLGVFVAEKDLSEWTHLLEFLRFRVTVHLMQVFTYFFIGEFVI